MQLNEKIIEKIELLSGLLKKSPDHIMDEALELYLKVEREKELEEDFEEHKKETNLSYDEFWEDLDFD